MNIFTVMVSVKSLTSKVRMNLPLRSSLFSQVSTLPLRVTSPISPSIFSISMGSSSKSRPYRTSGLLERLTEYFLSSPNPLSLSLPQPFRPLLSCGLSFCPPACLRPDAWPAPFDEVLSRPAAWYPKPPSVPIPPPDAWAISMSHGAASEGPDPESMKALSPCPPFPWPLFPFPWTSSWPSRPSVEKEPPMAASSSLWFCQ